jgi:hypothetical protein
MTNRYDPNRSRRETTTPLRSEAHTPEPQLPMSSLERLRAQALATTGGRTPEMFTGGLQGRAADFHREAEIRYKTNQKKPINVVPDKTPARDAAGPPINTNLTQLTSDAAGHVDTSMWMHDWFGHSCGCGED